MGSMDVLLAVYDVKLAVGESVADGDAD